MRCLVEIPARVILITPRGRGARGSQGLMIRSVLHKQIETTVYRVALPVVQNIDHPFVVVDAFIPPDCSNAIPALSEDWIERGVFRTKAMLSKNGKTLAWFLASGLAEMDVREIA